MKNNMMILVGLLALGLAGCQLFSKSQPAEPKSEAVATARMTPERAKIIGREMAEVLATRTQVVEDEQATIYLNRVGQYVALHMDNGPKNVKCVAGGEKVLPAGGFRFGVIRSKNKQTIALPNGFIFISDALIADLKSEDQLAGLLAHEATNVVCQHGMARMQKAADSVSRDKLATTYAKLWQTNLPLRFKKVGDRGALLALYKAGYYPEDYLQLVEGMGTKEASDRVVLLKKDYAKMQQKGVVDTKKSRQARFVEFQKMLTM